jgi:hypothetical protein
MIWPIKIPSNKEKIEFLFRIVHKMKVPEVTIKKIIPLSDDVFVELEISSASKKKSCFM